MNWKLTVTLITIFFAIGLAAGSKLVEPEVIVHDRIVEVIQPSEDPVVQIERQEQPAEYGLERASPSDWIAESQIYVYPNEVVLDIENAYWSTFTDTNSMDPVLDFGSNAVQIALDTPEKLAKVKVGDIISHAPPDFDGRIIHRVIETGYDADGWYALLQGDNNPGPDPYKVRADEDVRVVAAIIY